MTLEEFSNNFDILLNSYGDQGTSVVLDELEKSLFLTEAQDQIVVELYTGRNNKGASFEGTEELRSNLRGLIMTATLNEDTKEHKGLSKLSRFFQLPKDVLFITYESAILDDSSAGCLNGNSIEIVPVSQDELHRVMRNPFRGCTKKRALRLDNGLDTLEIISKYNIKDYTLRYLRKPVPIILTDIDEEHKETECELDSAMHRYILERAVALAIASRGIQNKGNV